MNIDRVEILFFISPNFVKKLTIQVKKKESTYPFQPSCNCFFRIQSIFYLKVIIHLLSYKVSEMVNNLIGQLKIQIFSPTSNVCYKYEA